MAKANGSFQITSFNEDTYEDRGERAKLTHAWGDQAFSGDIEGDGQVHWLMAYRPDGTATYVGLQRIRGAVGGRQGSFVIDASGDFDGAASRGKWSIIPGSGTDDLKDITGTGAFEAPGGPEATYELDYDLGDRTMVTWAEFSSMAPDLAAEGRLLIYRGDVGEALLATVREGDPPRIHPIWVGIVDDRLYAFIGRSPKRRDLAADGRYALHTHQDPAVPKEFSVRGRAILIDSAEVRAAVGAKWYFEPDETYELFEFAIESALLGLRDDPDEWPPRYTSWAAASDRFLREEPRTDS